MGKTTYCIWPYKHWALNCFQTITLFWKHCRFRPANETADQDPLFFIHTMNPYYSKTCLKRPPKNKQKILTTNGSLMKVESIAECSQAFCNTFDLH